MPARLHEQDALRLKKLEEEFQELKRHLTDAGGARLVVASLAPEPYDVLAEIPVWVRPEEASTSPRSWTPTSTPPGKP